MVMPKSKFPWSPSKDLLISKPPVVTAEYLYKKYVAEGLTIQQIGKLVGRGVETLRYYFRKYKIPTRRRGPKERHLKKPFSGDLAEKAYLVGIKYGDFHAYKEYNCIIVSVTTTHPAMLRLFHKLFNKYGLVKFRSLFCDSRGYEWNAYCRLDLSFEFLLWLKEEGIPGWIKDNDNYFLNFLAGYFDAEGHISITRNSTGNTCRLRYQMNSKDYNIIRDIQEKLTSFNISSKIYRNENIWRLDIPRRKDVIALLKLLPSQHEEKLIKRGLAFDAYNSSWEEFQPNLQKFKSLIKKEVEESILAAKKT